MGVAYLLAYDGATSRFDLTIGGMVNFNAGYITKGIGTAGNFNDNMHGSTRESSSTATNILAEHGNVRYSAADSAINFLSRGPNAFGAKTSGMLQIDFRGTNTGGIFGNAQIQYGWVKLDWANSYLLMGQAGPELLSLYARKFIIAGDHSNTEGIGGSRPIVIAYRHNLHKNFNVLLGLTNNTGQNGATGNNNSYARSSIPNFMTELTYQSEACGKIGPDMLKFGLGAIWGREKKTSNNAANINALVDETLDVWMVGLRNFVPIIPEKRDNKTNALGFSWIGYVGQNVNTFIGGSAPGPGSYWRPVTAGSVFSQNAAAPTVYGGSAQLTYYFNNITFVNAYYGAFKVNWSDYARVTAPRALIAGETDWKGPDRINQLRVYGANIFHDPSPSVRIGFQWIRMHTNYNAYGIGGQGSAVTAGAGNLENYGTVDQYKAMIAYYF